MAELSDDEKRGVAEIRAVMGDTIPEELNTDFNLRRWWKGNHGRLEEIKQKMSAYLENRRILGFDNPDFVANFYENQENKDILRFFRMSKIDATNVNSDNGIVFVEGGQFDKNVVRTTTTGKYLRVFFRCCEMVLKLILAREQSTGRPSHGICIFDLGSVDLANHLNPLSACNKVFQARALIWQDFYPEMMQRIVIANPPYFLGLIWTVIRHLLNEQAQKLLFFAHKKDAIFSVIDRRLVPVAFGGDFKDKSGWSKSDDCCNDNKRFTDDDLYVDGTIWRHLGLSCPPSSPIQIQVKPGRMHRIVCSPTSAHNHPSFIAWHFFANNEVQFAVRNGSHQWSNTIPVSADNSNLLYPNLRLVTTKVAEEDILETDERCWLHFANTSHYFTLKVDLVLLGLVISHEDLASNP